MALEIAEASKSNASARTLDTNKEDTSELEERVVKTPRESKEEAVREEVTHSDTPDVPLRPQEKKRVSSGLDIFSLDSSRPLKSMLQILHIHSSTPAYFFSVLQNLD